MVISHLWMYAGFLALITALVQPLGIYLDRVFNAERTFLDTILRPVERAFYRLGGIDPAQEMDWRQYLLAFILFGALGTAFVFIALLLQPLAQPADASFHPAPLSPLLAFNTAISFSTTTTWQAYTGEAALSYLSQAFALTSQNFLAGAAGLAVGIAFIRGFARAHCNTLGNFWVDVTRAVLWVLLPIAVVGALALVALGVPQNWSAYVSAQTLEGVVQLIPQGPVAALEFIKNLGTNGGGYFGANGAHPYANPSALSNLLGNLAIVALPAALTHTFGRMSKRPLHGWLLYVVMAGLFFAGLVAYDSFEQAGNPRVAALDVDAHAGALQSGGNTEGKETRFGVAASTLTAIATSNGATGSSNSALDSNSPLGGGVLLFNMMLGESLFGGLGTGLYSLVLTALIAVFVCGLMIGRTPEYLGKTVGMVEAKWIGLHTIISPAVILPLSALAMTTNAGLAGLSTNHGAHGYTTLLFAFTSCFANNGQTFGGLSADAPFFHVTTVIAMLAGRYGLAVPVLALAGRFAQQGHRAVSSGTLPTDGLLFGGILSFTLVLITGLSFLPALAMGPVVEHLQLWR